MFTLTSRPRAAGAQGRVLRALCYVRWGCARWGCPQLEKQRVPTRRPPKIVFQEWTPRSRQSPGRPGPHEACPRCPSRRSRGPPAPGASASGQVGTRRPLGPRAVSPAQLPLKSPSLERNLSRHRGSQEKPHPHGPPAPGATAHAPLLGRPGPASTALSS